VVHAGHESGLKLITNRIDTNYQLFLVCNQIRAKVPRHDPCLTYGGDHSYGEVKRAGKFPLHPGFVRLQVQHHLLQLLKVLRGQVEGLQELRFIQVLVGPLGRLLPGFQRVEDRGADYQIGEGADDQGEGPHVLPLHGGVVRVRGTGGV